MKLGGGGCPVFQVAIIGAGPYGLSVAAHLRPQGVDFRIFGRPMESWRANMPRGMFLKSEGFASNLYDPGRRSTLNEFCLRHGIAYGETGVPISLETIIAYGLSFQRLHVPELDERMIEAVDHLPQGFRLRLDDGETVMTRNVVVAVGGGYFRHVPSTLEHLPAVFLSHSSDHHDLDKFHGQHVTVIGGGASAFDIAALLHEIDVDVHLVARRPSLLFHSKDRPRNMWHKVRYPLSGIGPGWRNRFFTDMPMIFRHLPQDIRLHTVRNHLGPAGAWLMKDRVVGRVPLLLGSTPTSAEKYRGRVRLQLVDKEGMQSEVITDHVIAATGYKIDLRRLTFLSEELRSSLRLVEDAPVLSGTFESSVPGLYFVGLASAYDYGPVMRFMFGARYTAGRLSKHFGRNFRSTASRGSAP